MTLHAPKLRVDSEMTPEDEDDIRDVQAMEEKDAEYCDWLLDRKREGESKWETK
jgi:hypothetical protein